MSRAQEYFMNDLLSGCIGKSNNKSLEYDDIAAYIHSVCQDTYFLSSHCNESILSLLWNEMQIDGT